MNSKEKEPQKISTTDTQLNTRYLLFYIGNELYGTPLLDVREVVEYQAPKVMPNMVAHFSGVINIRGAIVGVIDLRKMFGVQGEINKQTSLLVSDTEQGSIAAIVDRIDSVASISNEDLERNPPVVSQVKNEFLIGVAKNKDRLVTVVELKKFLTDEKFVRQSA
jgi:purine-binding chemotaxis protein CheW